MSLAQIAVVLDKDAIDQNSVAVKGYPEQALLGLAHEIGLFPLKCRNTSDIVSSLLDSPHRVLLVHVSSDHWRQLLEKLGEARTAIRFSTGNVPPIGPQGPNSNGFSCVKKTRGSLTSHELRVIVHTCSNSKIVNSLKSHFVPDELRGIFQFVEPRRLQSLYMLIHADLVSRGIDPEAPIVFPALDYTHGRPQLPELLPAIAHLTLKAPDYRRVIDLPADRAKIRSAAAEELSIEAAQLPSDITALLEMLATGYESTVLPKDVLCKAYRQLRDALKAR